MNILGKAYRTCRSAIALLYLIISISCLYSCSKSSEPEPANPLENSYWYGRFHYSSGTLERVMCLYLKGSNRFEWHDASGMYTGSWNLSGDKLTIIFDLNKHETTFTVSENKLTGQANVNHNDWTILELSAIEKYPLKLSDSEWFDPYSWLLTFTDDRLVFYYAGMPTVIGGGGNYKLNGPILTISNGNFDGKESAGLFGVFRDEILMTVNILSAPGLGNVPTRISNATSFVKQ